MADSNADFDFEFGKNKMSAELDENNELISLGAKNGCLNLKFIKKPSRKEIDRTHFFYSTGIPQLSTVAPNPLDREELIDKEHSTKPLLLKSWFVALVTLAAIALDFSCYLEMFESFLEAVEDSSGNTFLIALAAAVAIDVLPMFFAQILHYLSENQRKVLNIFFIISFIFVVGFIIVLFLVRCKFFSTRWPDFIKEDHIVIYSLIPIATSLVCFIFNYLSYDPCEKKIKTLSKVKLFRQENINEITSVLKEIESDSDFTERMIKADEALYDSAVKRIDAAGEYCRAYVRTILMAKLHSPADTSDLADYESSFAWSETDLPIK